MPNSRSARTGDVILATMGTAPFRVRDAAAAGISRSRLRTAATAGQVVVLRHGVLVHRSAVPAGADATTRHALAARGLALALADDPMRYVFSHATAAVLNELPYPGLHRPADWPVEVTRERATFGTGADWRSHLASLPPAHVTHAHGLPVTTLSRTAVDLAADRPLADALPVIDAVARRLALQTADLLDQRWEADRSVVRRTDLRAAVIRVLLDTLDESGRRRSRRHARRVLTLADPGAENGFESVSRAHVIIGGLPVPIAGYPVIGDDGRTYWGDPAWPELRVIGEADGRGKYTDPAILYAEKRRQEALERAGWIVVRWTWDELARDPALVVARIARALDRAARRSA